MTVTTAPARVRPPAVRVTWADIKYGTRGHPEACAVALAASRAFGEQVSVSYSGLCAGTRRVKFDRRVTRRVRRFDRFHVIFPFTISLGE